MAFARRERDREGEPTFYRNICGVREKENTHLVAPKTSDVFSHLAPIGNANTGARVNSRRKY